MGNIAAGQSEHRSSDQDVMIARQPIYNSSMGVFGYELLFRAPGGSNKGMNLTAATAQVITSTILEFGLEKFVHKRKAFINVTRAFIEVIPEVPLPPKQVVLDIPDNIAIDEKLITQLKALQSMGYGLSIGGMANLKDTRLLPIADIFRVDVQKFNVNQLDALTKFLRRYNNLALQALKVETLKEYRIYRDKGFDYLQGYFLGKPREYVSRDLSANKLAILQLLATVHNLNTPTEELEQLITSDVPLSYKLIKLVNAPFFGVAQEVDSIKRAIVLLGRDEIRKWVSLLALGETGNTPVASMEIAILRAKMCELLAEKAGLPQDGYFTVGMFSALDILMEQPIKSILANLPLSESVKAAILERQGMQGEALNCALAIENADWSEMNFANLSQNQMAEVYRQAIRWAVSVLKQF